MRLVVSSEIFLFLFFPLLSYVGCILATFFCLSYIASITLRLSLIRIFSLRYSSFLFFFFFFPLVLLYCRDHMVLGWAMVIFLSFYSYIMYFWVFPWLIKRLGFECLCIRAWGLGSGREKELEFESIGGRRIGISAFGFLPGCERILNLAVYIYIRCYYLCALFLWFSFSFSFAFSLFSFSSLLRMI